MQSHSLPNNEETVPCNNITCIFVPAVLRSILIEKDYDLVLFNPKSNLHCDKYLPMLTSLHYQNFINFVEILSRDETAEPIAKEDNPATKYFWANPLAHQHTFLILSASDIVVAYAKISINFNVEITEDTVSSSHFKITEKKLDYLSLNYMAVDYSERCSGIGSVLLASVEMNANAFYKDQRFNISYMGIYSLPTALNFYRKGNEFVENRQGEWNLCAKLPIDSQKIENRISVYKSKPNKSFYSFFYGTPLSEYIDESIFFKDIFTKAKTQTNTKFLADEFALEESTTPTSPDFFQVRSFVDNGNKTCNDSAESKKRKLSDKVMFPNLFHHDDVSPRSKKPFMQVNITNKYLQ